MTKSIFTTVSTSTFCFSQISKILRLLDTNFESLENLMMLYIVRKVLASLVEFSNFDDVASCVTQQHMIFVTKRVVAKTAVDRVW